MNAREEALDLMANPLPSVVIVDPLTRVWDLEKEIQHLTEQISDLIREKDAALNYAIKEQIAEDEHCRLDQKIKRFRSLNVERFREVFPQEYNMACSIERKEKMDALDHIGEKVNLTLVDRLVKKAALEAAQGVVSVKESVSYAVIRK